MRTAREKQVSRLCGCIVIETRWSAQALFSRRLRGQCALSGSSLLRMSRRSGFDLDDSDLFSSSAAFGQADLVHLPARLALHPPRGVTTLTDYGSGGETFTRNSVRRAESRWHLNDSRPSQLQISFSRSERPDPVSSNSLRIPFECFAKSLPFSARRPLHINTRPCIRVPQSNSGPPAFFTHFLSPNLVSLTQR